LASIGGMDPFTRPDSPDLVEMLTDGVVRVLRSRGLQEFSIAASARAVDMSPQALNERFSGKYGARRRVLQLVTNSYGERWLEWVRPGLAADPPLIQLPESDEEISGVRVRLALAELARGEGHAGNPHLAGLLESFRATEADLVSDAVRRWAGRLPNRVQLTILTSLTDGLRAELAAPHARIDHPAAVDALARAVADLGAILRRRRPSSAMPDAA
jgi:AcrR family transcriptional regulator